MLLSDIVVYVDVLISALDLVNTGDHAPFTAVASAGSRDFPPLKMNGIFLTV